MKRSWCVLETIEPSGVEVRSLCIALSFQVVNMKLASVGESNRV
jgi:hypothetical protein